VESDEQISSRDNGSLPISAIEPAAVRLFETGDVDIEIAHLIYQAKVRQVLLLLSDMFILD
jgi:hypothetical protein